MGLFRKMLSVNTLGVVDFRSDKERIARSTRHDAKAGKQGNKLMAEQNRLVAEQNALLAEQRAKLPIGAPGTGWNGSMTDAEHRAVVAGGTDALRRLSGLAQREHAVWKSMQPARGHVVEPQPADDATRIRQFAELRDAGLLTAEEFEAKKRQILDL